MTGVTFFEAFSVAMMRTKRIPRRKRSCPLERLAQLPVVRALRNLAVVVDFWKATARMLTWVSKAVVILLLMDPAQKCANK